MKVEDDKWEEQMVVKAVTMMARDCADIAREFVHSDAERESLAEYNFAWYGTDTEDYMHMESYRNTQAWSDVLLDFIFENLNKE